MKNYIIKDDFDLNREAVNDSFKDLNMKHGELINRITKIEDNHRNLSVRYEALINSMNEVDLPQPTDDTYLDPDETFEERIAKELADNAIYYVRGKIEALVKASPHNIIDNGNDTPKDFYIPLHLLEEYRDVLNASAKNADYCTINNIYCSGVRLRAEETS